ncbi:MAG: M1 family peptidase, partial [Pyrinomonadaceae bacterium]|nr:M1 family peptidase [Pyrinomonadaceae bacterium]
MPSVRWMFILVFASLAALPALAQRPTISDQPLSERRVAYTIVVNLDPERRMLRGTEKITWRNPDRVAVDELQFHLYLNAFKNERSTFMRESGGALRGFAAEGEDRWGWIDIKQLRVADAPAPEADLTNALQFIHPDDDNGDDQTVAAVRLLRPVPSGGSITLDVTFEARLPKIFARTGWAETDNRRLFFMV